MMSSERVVSDFLHSKHTYLFRVDFDRIDVFRVKLNRVKFVRT